MIKLKKLALLMSSSFLFAACAGDVGNNANTDTTESTGSEVVDSTEVDTGADVESDEQVEESSAVESSEEASTAEQEDTAKIEEALDVIATETEYGESNGYMFIVDSVEGNLVQINVREDNEAVANNLALLQYDTETGTLYEQDIITGEFVEYPANQ